MEIADRVSFLYIFFCFFAMKECCNNSNILTHGNWFSRNYSAFFFFFFKQSSPSSPEPASLPAEDLSTNSNGPKPAEIMLDGDREDLFAGNDYFLLACLHKPFFLTKSVS